MTLRTLLDRFELLMDTPESVPKLRRFILQLAVQGRLSDRRASDEPVEVLLERMEDEKERLDAAGEYKYQKTMPPIEEDDIPFSFLLPEGWTWVRLGNLGKVYGGGTPKKSNAEYWGGEIPWVSPKDMNGAVIQSTEDQITQKGLEGSSAKLVPPGSLLIVGRSGILERKLPVGVTAVECTANQDLKVLTPFVSGMARYIRLMLKGFEPYILAELVKTGTTVRSLKYTEFQLQPYPLPPIDEQQRIVEKADGLMDECDALEQQQERERTLQVQVGTAAAGALQSADDAEALRPAWERVRQHFDTVTATPEGVDALRQTILQLAVQGRLTERDPDDTPADVLLDQIQQEKQRLYDAGEIRKPKGAPPISEMDGLPELPTGWKWARLCNLIYEIKAGSSPACKDHTAENGNWGVLRTTAVQEVEYRQHENKELPDDKVPRTDQETEAGDVLITRAGPRHRVGVACYVEQTRGRLMYSDKIIRCLTDKDSALPEYLALAINSGLSNQFIDDNKSGMAESQMNISQTNLRATPIPVPPLGEQKRIIDTVESLLSDCVLFRDRMEKFFKIGDKLLSSVLDRTKTSERVVSK